MGIKGDGFRGSLDAYRKGYDAIFNKEKCPICGKEVSSDEMLEGGRGARCVKCSEGKGKSYGFHK